MGHIVGQGGNALHAGANAVGSALHTGANALGNVAQAGVHAVGQVLLYVSTPMIAAVKAVGKQALILAVNKLNDGLTAMATSDFSQGVTDALIDFALNTQNLPGDLKTALADLKANPDHGWGYFTRWLQQQLSLITDGGLLMHTLNGLWDLIQGLKNAADCQRLGYMLGYALTSLVLNLSVQELGNKLSEKTIDALFTRILDRTLHPPARSPCGRCFPAGTEVATPNGEQPIETLKPSDTVLTEDPKTGKVEAEKVQALIVDPTSYLVSVQLSDGSTIKATADHPFYVEASAVRAQAGWVWAGYLLPGDRLRSASGHDITATGVRYNVGTAVVYTLTVANDHDFFVGTARVLVHNLGVPQCPAQGVGLAREQRTYRSTPLTQMLVVGIQRAFGIHQQAFRISSHMRCVWYTLQT